MASSAEISDLELAIVHGFGPAACGLLCIEHSGSRNRRKVLAAQLDLIADDDALAVCSRVTVANGTPSP